MNKTFIATLAALALGSFTSCENKLDSVDDNLGTGYLSLSVNQDYTLIGSTKADGETGAEMTIEINDKTYSCTSGETKSIALPEGTGYTATAYNKSAADVKALEWNAPYYFGSTSEGFSITTDKETQVSITCPLGNSIISYDDSELGTLVSISSLFVKAGDITIDDFKKTSNEDTRKLYAKVGTTATVFVTVQLVSNNSITYTASTEVNVSEAKKDYKIHYKFSNEGTGKFTITLDDGVTEDPLYTTITPTSGNSN